MRQFYHNEGVTDLDKIRIDARKNVDREEVIIHMHKYDVPCDGLPHEFYSSDEIPEDVKDAPRTCRFWFSENINCGRDEDHEGMHIGRGLL